MKTEIEQLVGQGHTLEEADQIVRITETALADRDVAMRTGRCSCCNARMVRTGLGRIECFRCEAVHAA